MGWLPKFIGAENFWMAIRLVPIKTDRVQVRPKPEQWSCPWRLHPEAIKTFWGREFLDGDSFDAYTNQSLVGSAQKTRTMVMPMAAVWIGYQKFSGPKMVGWRFY